MPATENQGNGRPDLQEVIGGYQEIVATLIRSLIGVPGFPAAYQERLYACIAAVKNMTATDQFRTLPKRIEELCASAVSEIGTQGGVKQQEEEIRRIVDMLGESIRSLAEVNASTGSSLETHISDLQEAVEADGEPAEFSARIEAIAKSITQTTTILRNEVEESRSQVKNAGRRIQDLEQELQQTRAETLKDGLTGLENRRSFNQFVAQALSSFDPQRPWCAIMLDVDHFKRVNDTNGHIIGDALLIKLSRTLRSQVAEPSYLARYGGEEFIIMLSGSPLRKGVKFCDKLLRKIRNSRWQYRGDAGEITISATLSAGVAVQKSSDTPESLVARADEALYIAKENGRDRLQTEEDIK